MSYFAALEDEWLASRSSRRKLDASMTTPHHQSEDEERGLHVTEVERSTAGLRGCQDEGKETASDNQFGREEHETPPPPVAHELTAAPDTLTTAPVLP